jgi:DNA-binding Lrp family transcriptional regulator
MKAYILINIRTGDIHEVVRNLRRLDGVVEAHMVFGIYDAIAVVEGQDLKTIGALLASNIQPIPGVLDTITCLAVDD